MDAEVITTEEDNKNDGEELELTITSDVDAIDSFVDRIKQKKIVIHHEFDREIISQLTEYIEQLQKDCVKCLESARNYEKIYSTLEVECLSLRDELYKLQSENKIRVSQATELQQDKSSELMELQTKLETKQKELEQIESEIQLKQGELSFVSKEVELTAEKSSADPGGLGILIMTPETDLATQNISFEEVNKENSELQDLNHVLTKNNDILNSQLVTHENVVKQQDITIQEQITLINELTNEIAYYESTIMELNERLNDEQHNIDDLKRELSIKEKVISQRKHNREQSVVNIIGGSSVANIIGGSSVASNVATLQSIFGVNSNTANYSYARDSMTPKGARSSLVSNKGGVDGLSWQGGATNLFTIKSGMDTDIKDDKDADSVSASETMVERSDVLYDDAAGLMLENQQLKSQIKSVENRMIQLKNQHGKQVTQLQNQMDQLDQKLKKENGKLIKENKKLKTKNKQLDKQLKFEKSENQRRKNSKAQKQDAQSCVLFGAQFW